MTFSTGEAILLLRRIDENWLEGELDGKVGIFPSNRVRVEVGSPSLSQDSAIARSGKPCTVVLHDFEGGESGDLPLEEGQIVELLGRIAAGWMRGRLNGKVGIFPASFVEVVQPLRTVCRPVPHPQSQAPTSPPLSPANPKPRPRPMPRPRGPKRAENVYKISGFLIDFCGFVWVDQSLSTWISGFLSSSCTRFLLCF